MLTLRFYGAARFVTGSCTILETDSGRVMVDCGLFQGPKEIKERNYGSFPFDPASIDCLLLTHAHIDHSGLIPKLVKHGFQGKIYTTTVTADLCSVMLPDSGHIQEMEVQRKNRKLNRAGKELLEPIYTVQDAYNALNQFIGLQYGEPVETIPGMTARFLNAGHILGSAMVELNIQHHGKTTKLLFSGDIGNRNQPIVEDPATVESADYVVMESTYGNRLHDPPSDKVATLGRIIKDTFRRGGNLIIPAFAVERTQDLLLTLDQLVNAGVLAGNQIYIDSPLAINATEIYCRHSHYFDAQTKAIALTEGRDCALMIPGLQFTRTAEESIALNRISGGAVIISASGMCDAGRIKHHLKHNLWRPESTVLLVGFQAEGTLGRRLLEGDKLVRIHGEQIAVKATITTLPGFSAHADRAGLLNWLRSFQVRPKCCFINHGEETSALAFAQSVINELGIPVLLPSIMESFDLDSPLFTPETGRKGVSAEEVALAYQNIQQMLKKVVEEGVEAGNYASLLEKLHSIEREISRKI